MAFPGCTTAANTSPTAYTGCQPGSAAESLALLRRAATAASITCPARSDASRFGNAMHSWSVTQSLKFHVCSHRADESAEFCRCHKRPLRFHAPQERKISVALRRVSRRYAFASHNTVKRLAVITAPCFTPCVNAATEVTRYIRPDYQHVCHVRTSRKVGSTALSNNGQSLPRRRTCLSSPQLRPGPNPGLMASDKPTGQEIFPGSRGEGGLSKACRLERQPA